MSRLGRLRYRLSGAFVSRFMSYDAGRFAQTLRSLGLKRGDVLMVHASMRAHSGYSGTPAQMVSALKDILGSQGLLVMPSMTYSDSTKAFLLRGELFRGRTSPSHMGLLTEVFRRGKDVRRSLNPAHPLLAWGARADEFVAGHEFASRSFGDDSPFQRLLDLHAKILCIDASPEAVTFTHFLEDRHRFRLPFPLYESEPIEGRVVDANGETWVVPIYVLSDESRRRRHEEMLWHDAQREFIVQRKRVGNTTLLLMQCNELTTFFDARFENGKTWFVNAATT